MNVRKALVSFLTIAFIFVLAFPVSAYTVTPLTGGIVNIDKIEVNGINANNDVSVIAGETVQVRIFFTATTDIPSTTEVEESASNLRVRAVIEGEKQDIETRTEFFDVENGKSYVKTLSLRVPFNLRYQVSEDLPLNIKIWNSDLSTQVSDLKLRVQRPSYNVEITAVNTDRTVKAGEIFPIEIVLRNRGYNNLEDLSVNLKIAGLNIEKTAFFGELVNVRTSTEDGVDTVVGKLYLTVPYDAKPGVYTLEVKASNEDTISTRVAEVRIENEFPVTAIKTDSGLLLVNPTNSLVAYRVVTPTDESIVTVPAGLSRTVELTPTSEDYSVTILTMSGRVVETFNFRASEQPEPTAISSTVVVFTVILALIFLVLLIVLIVLITRKPQKSEDLGESYY